MTGENRTCQEGEAVTETSTHHVLDRMITGYWVSQAIYAAAKFGIADHLKNGPRSIDELAKLSSANPDALYRLLRALASVGIFEKPLNCGQSEGRGLSRLIAFSVLRMAGS